MPFVAVFGIARVLPEMGTIICDPIEKNVYAKTWFIVMGSADTHFALYVHCVNTPNAVTFGAKVRIGGI